MGFVWGLLHTPSLAGTLLALALVAATGLGLGTLRWRGLSLGVAGVLFTGLAAGHFGFAADPTGLRFVREMGLILFVFTIGMQIGPGFLSALRRQGALLGVLAGAIVLLGALLTVALARLAGLPPALAAGVFCGATTNTPALAAAQEALADPAARALAAAGYAVAYPLGILGAIASLLLLRRLFAVDVAREVEELEGRRRAENGQLARATLRVENPQLDGRPLGQVPGLGELGVVVSRVLAAGGTEVQPARAGTVLHRGDLLLAVGTRERLDQVELIIGPRVPRDLLQTPGRVTTRRLVVTRREVLGVPLSQVGLDHRFGVTVTRVTRAGVQMSARPALELQFGDVLRVVGEDAAIGEAEAMVGNSPRELQVTRFGGNVQGIGLGIVVGSLPLAPHDLPVPLRLGLAGGPLVVAIFLGMLGRLGRIVFYMPPNANLALRELGIVLFLACVGLASGPGFVDNVLHPAGLSAIGVGAAVTVLPLLAVGVVARRRFRLDFATLCGLLAGSVTDPPALAFAGQVTASDAPSVAYATVYPLAMLLRVVAAQLLVILWLAAG